MEGLVVDESLLLSDEEYGDRKKTSLFLLPEAAKMLRRLQYSNLRVVISYEDGVSSEKENLLQRIVADYCLECIPWKTSLVDNDAFHKLLISWRSCGGTCLYATSKRYEDLFPKLFNYGWKVIMKRAVGAAGPLDNMNVVLIDKLEELLFTLSRFSKTNEIYAASNVIIGYIMKPSREADFAKRGAFPLRPTQNGLIFVPLTLELPLSWQVSEVDAILHKATDEIISIDSTMALDFPKGIVFTEGMQQLERYIQDYPDCCLIDPLNNIYPMLDRLRIQDILLEIENLGQKNGSRIRGAQFLKLDDFKEANLKDKLSEAGLSFPNIVKPQVACGVSNAHNMALVFKTEHFRDLHVPLPAIVQEYVDHGSVLFKFYVIGDNVFYAVKKSMPNVKALKLSSEKNGSSSISFDSLKSLPVADVDLTPKGRQQFLNVELVTNAANWLRRKLELTIFGFDVVIQEGSNDHVIVDLNYLPSFKEVPDSVAIPAFWDAIKNSYETRKR